MEFSLLCVDVFHHVLDELFLDVHVCLVSYLSGELFQDEMESFDNPRMWKVGSIMCRICKVDCGTVDGLELHSQSREHQRKARDMVLSIKQQNKKKQRYVTVDLCLFYAIL